MKSTRCWVVGWDCDKNKYRPSWYSKRIAAREGLKTYSTYLLCLIGSAKMNDLKTK